MLDSNHHATISEPALTQAGDRQLTPPIWVSEGRIVVAFLEDDATATTVRTGLAVLGDGLDIRRGGLRQAIRFFRTAAPVHAALIDVSGIAAGPGASDDAVQPALDELARTCPPEVPIFLLGDSTDIGFYRLVVHQMGAADYFPRPLTRDVVQRQLLPRLLGTAPEPTDARSGRIVVVCGTRGGVGATTIAVNAALHLAGTDPSSGFWSKAGPFLSSGGFSSAGVSGGQPSAGQTALLDLNMHNGSAAMMFGARPGTGLRVALEDPARGDALFLERATIPVFHQGGTPRLHLIAPDEGGHWPDYAKPGASGQDSSAGRKSEAPSASPATDASLGAVGPPTAEDGVAHVLDVLRRRFNYVFVDLPVLPGWGPIAPELRRVLRLARHVVMVLNPDLASLRDAQTLRHVATAAAPHLSPGGNRVLTVLNRADMRGALRRDLIERGLGGPPDISIPDLGGRMTEAVNIGTPALTHVPALRRHLLPLVRELAELPPASRSGWLRRLVRT